MKKTTLTIASLLVAVFAITTTANAQKMRGGIKGGLNASNLYIDDVEDENVRLGFHVGVYTQIGQGAFAIQPELNFSTKGAKAEYDIGPLEGESKFNLSYIDLPVLATFKLGDGADIHLGPYFGYLVGVSTSTEGDLGDGEQDLDRDDYEKWDFGLAGGVALNFNPMSIGFRYNYGLKEIAKSDNAESFIGDAKNSVGQVYLAFDLR